LVGGLIAWNSWCVALKHAIKFIEEKRLEFRLQTITWTKDWVAAVPSKCLVCDVPTSDLKTVQATLTGKFFNLFMQNTGTNTDLDRPTLQNNESTNNIWIQMASDIDNGTIHQNVSQ
jgi:hypothetical protein